MSFDSRAPLDRSPKSNWVEDSGGLPMYIRRIANHIHVNGHSISESIAAAVNMVKRMCATGTTNVSNSVNPASHAEACAAVAEWESKKAAARIGKSNIRGRKMTDKEYIDMLMVEEVLKAGFNPKEIRDFRGRWVNLPGSHAYKKVGVWEQSDGTHGLYKNGEQKPTKTFKTKSAAKTAMQRIVNKDGLPNFANAGKEKNAKSNSRKPTRAQRLADYDKLTKPQQVQYDRIMNGTGSGSINHKDALNQISSGPSLRTAAQRNAAARKVDQARNAAKPLFPMLEKDYGTGANTDAELKKIIDPTRSYPKRQIAEAKKEIARRKVKESGVSTLVDRWRLNATQSTELKNLPTNRLRAYDEAMWKKNNHTAAMRVALTFSVKKSFISDAEFNGLIAEADFSVAPSVVEFDLTGEISKSDDDKQLVFGWTSVAKRKDGEVVVDKQGDVLDDIDAMEAVAYDFVLNSRDGGEMHIRKGVSTLVESFVSTPEKWAAMGIPEGVLPVGWWCGFHVNDTEVWKAVKDKKYTQFSVHGTGQRIAIEEIE